MSVPLVQPPRFARSILVHSLPADAREDVATDMDILYRNRLARDGVWPARRWYISQAFSFAVRFGTERLWMWWRSRGVTGPPASWLDWKLGVRMLFKHPGLALIGGLALAGAIGIGVVWFEMVQETLYPTLPLEDGDRIVRVEAWNAAASRTQRLTQYDLKGWRESLTSVQELGAYRTLERNLFSPDGRAEPTVVAEITASAFPTTRVPPFLGRPLLAEDEKPGAPPVVVLSHEVWQHRLDGDSGIIGQTVQLGRIMYTVVGVMPEGFGFPVSHQLWVPLPQTGVPAEEAPRVAVFGRLAPGATFASAQAELTAVGWRMEATSSEPDAVLRPRVRAYAGPTPGDPLEPQFILMFAGIILILTVASANVATLVFARTAMRESEIVVRSTLGASRARIIGQLFVEALVLSSVAAAAGFGLAQLGMRWFWHEVVVVWQVPQPFWTNYSIEPSTYFFTAALALFGAALVGILPALKATSPRLQPAIQRISGGGTNLRFGGIWSVIIVMQVAITVICLPLGIGISREMVRDHLKRSAFSTERYLTFVPEFDQDDPPSVDAGKAGFGGRFTAVMDEMRTRLLAQPEVAQMTFGDGLPGMSHPRQRVEVQRGTEPPTLIDGNLDGTVAIATVGIGFFSTFRVPVVAGRGFAAGDPGTEPLPVIVNESLAQKLGGTPLGVNVRVAAFRDGMPGPWQEIVGVVRNLGMEPTDRGEADFIFQPASVADVYPPVVALLIPGGPAAFEPRLRALAREIDPGLRLKEVLPMEEVVRRRTLPMVMITLGATGVVFIAVLLSAAGLFAIMAVAVARRTREIGIRMALGASRRSVLHAIFARAAGQLSTGILLGNLAFLLLALLTGGMPKADFLLALLLISSLMVLVGLVACAVPMQRVLRIQPTDALREE